MREEIFAYRNTGMSPEDIASLMEISVNQVHMVLGLEDPATTSTIDPFGALQTLRSAGYAVVAFSPEELNGVPSNKVEDKLALIGYDVIEHFVRHPEDRQ